jgi:hypothetical protein
MQFTPRDFHLYSIIAFESIPTSISTDVAKGRQRSLTTEHEIETSETTLSRICHALFQPFTHDQLHHILS